MDERVKLVIERWLIKADHDLQTAKLVLSDEPPITDTACFHCQQCVEKCLKAYLVSVDEHVEKTHFLIVLVERCAKHNLEFLKLSKTAEMLTKYVVTTRYPDDWREIPANEAEEAVRNAEEVMTFVKGKLRI